jgi:hypothetical protein
MSVIAETEIVKVIADLIAQEMDLESDRVFLYNQDAALSTDTGIYVNVGILGAKPFGTSVTQVSDPVAGLLEIQTVNVQEIYSILIYSQDGTARQRKQEIIFALNGQAAQQAMEKYSFRIGNLPAAFVDVSEVERTYRLNRYSLTFNVLVAYARSRAVDYFNNFTGSPSLIVNP